ncbi:MAG TPA: MlaE family lipid ABC transporter permease subunit [Chitinivibrionales bacterium]|jgi:phospholipid/cholesterol/gamma-HCH transport system permease protein|nr:MlaE family lipid ABC transporter permease subunit [Chitinivibrionales bacterium]
MDSVIELPDSITRDWIEKEGYALLSRPAADAPVLDASRTRLIDSSGISLLSYVGRAYAKTGKRIVLRNASEAVLSALRGAAPPPADSFDRRVLEQNILLRLGDAVVTLYNTLVLALSMLAEILYWGTFGLLKKRDFRKGAIEQQMFQMGYKALGIVGLLSFLIGNVLALQAAMQLEHFGAGIFLAPMIVISMIKELGPLMTAIILTGRNGSAITAEIATMVVGEEIDALRTMGIHPIQYVIIPKFFALSVTMPLLSITASLTGLLSGYLVAVLYLDISSGLFIREMMKNIVLADVVANIVKSIVFSWLIIWIGAFHGFRVRGGAEAVGRETTASVVTGIFVIIMADAAFSFIF